MALTDALFYPSLGFHFVVRFIGSLPLSAAEVDSRWVEVTGLQAELTTEELIEGGENRFVHKLPLRAKYGNLILKRGYFSSLPSPLINWANDALLNFEINPIQVQVILLNDMHVPAQFWVFNNAYPVKMSTGDLKATDSAFVMESLELSYQYFKRFSAMEALSNLVF